MGYEFAGNGVVLGRGFWVKQQKPGKVFLRVCSGLGSKNTIKPDISNFNFDNTKGKLNLPGV